jgi:hypothetical protein
MRENFIRLTTAAVVVGAAWLATLESANATPAFARSTGAACTKCHTEDFPRLTARGERFMRNGFQIRSEAGAEIQAPQEGDKKEGEGLKKVASDLWLNNFGDIFSAYVEVLGFEKTTRSKSVTIAKPDNVALLATGSLAKDIPFWAELEYNPADNEWEADRLFIGSTNMGDTTLLNARIGSLDPTQWTSFYGNAAGAFKSAANKLGAYEGSGEASGFSNVGTGLTPRRAVEYYGYNDQFLWSVAVANTPDDYQQDNERNLDYWATVRYDFLKGSSVSVLYYDANSALETKVWSVAANFRTAYADLLAQYSRDDGGTFEGGDRKEHSGYTLEADVPVVKHWLAIARYDTTDNGLPNDNSEEMLSLGVVYTPVQNLKITTALVTELKQAITGEGDPADVSGKTNTFTVNLMYGL